MKTIFKFFICLFVFFACTPVFAADMVDINTASLQQLDTLSGIGPTYAQRIVDGRPYSSVDDLLRVKGIGPTTLQKIKDQGLAYVGGQIQQPAQTTPTPEATPAPYPTPTPAPDTTPDTTLSLNAQQSPQATTQTADSNIAPAAYPSGIIFNEIMPNPQGADETEEWIEIHNTNNFEADLSGWKIQDSVGTITNFIFPAGTKIAALGYLVLRRPQTKIMMNNSGDGLNLFSPDGRTVNSVEFVNAPLGLSYNFTSSGWKWSSRLTPGLPNIVLNTSKTTKSSAAKSGALSSAQKNTDKNNASDNTTAALIDSMPEEKPFSFLLFSGILLAVILGIIFFIIIIKLKTPDSPA